MIIIQSQPVSDKMQRERFYTLDLCLNRQRTRLPPELRAYIKKFLRRKPLTNETIREAIRKYFGPLETGVLYMPHRMEVIREYGHISDWNTENVTDMSRLFENRERLKENLNLWDTGKVTTMKGMFTRCTFFNLPIYKWDVSNVTDMSEMFAHATWFNQPLYNWNTRSLVDASHMFYYAQAFNQPLDGWNTENLQLTHNMFEKAISFNQSLHSWNKSNLQNARYMFDGSGMPQKSYWAFRVQQERALAEAGRRDYTNNDEVAVSYRRYEVKQQSGGRMVRRIV